MNDIARAKEKYRLLLEGDTQDDGFLEELARQAKDCGVAITPVSPSEIVMEGENSSLLELFIWLLDASRLAKVRYLKPEQ